MSKIIKEDLIRDFISIGIQPGNMLLIRGDLGAVGRVVGGANTFIEALLELLGPEGTIVSLAFTGASFLKKPKIEDAFFTGKKSYAGALPNAMLAYPNAKRSRHPMCSYVAIGKHADHITADHDENSPAYEPVRKVIEADGKCILVGCVKSSPGFTTAHLAEHDLGMASRVIFSKSATTYYKDKNHELKLFRRNDPGLCSNSYWKFYSSYVREEVLTAGFVGKAYSIIAPAKKTYEIEYKALSVNKKFNICHSKDCFSCNANRWDRLHHLPVFVFRKFVQKFRRP